MTTCRHVATDQPRLLNGQHLHDCDDAGCAGCDPCRERHCRCGRHLDDQHPLTCPRCVGYTRDDLDLIGAMVGSPLLTEAVHRGVNSEAMMLNGPAADPQAWAYRALSAMVRRTVPGYHLSECTGWIEEETCPGCLPMRTLDDSYLEDCHDELHPLFVLGTWLMVWQEFLGHDTDALITVPDALAYLATQLTYMAQRDEPDFAQFAAEVRACRGHLEDVLRDGERPETGAPCPMCGRAALTKDWDDEDEGTDYQPERDEKAYADQWTCPKCGTSYSEEDYRSKVHGTYLFKAPVLTASQMREAYRVPEGTTRRWASGRRPSVRTRGYDGQGRQLYDVADVLAARDAQVDERAAC